MTAAGLIMQDSRNVKEFAEPRGRLSSLTLRVSEKGKASSLAAVSFFLALERLVRLLVYFRFETYSPDGSICLMAVICPFSSTNSTITSANSGILNLSPL